MSEWNAYITASAAYNKTSKIKIHCIGACVNLCLLAVNNYQVHLIIYQ